LFRDELADFKRLSSALAELHEKHETQKTRIIILLNEMAVIRRRLEKELGKAKRLTRRLTSIQKNEMGFLHDPGKVEYAVRRAPAQWGFGIRAEDSIDIPFTLKPLLIPELLPVKSGELPEEYKNIQEIKIEEIRLISMMDKIRKKLLNLELLEMRLKELMLSVSKALQTYSHQWKRIIRSVYPLGIFSVCHKSLREMLGTPHYSKRDLEGIAFLGNLAGNIIKMANSSVF